MLRGWRGGLRYRPRGVTPLLVPTGAHTAGRRVWRRGCAVCRGFRDGSGPAHRAYRGRPTPFCRSVGRPGVAVRRRRRVLAGCEPAALAARSAAVGRRGGRSVHGVPRLEHLRSVCALPQSEGACFPRGRSAFPSLSRPMRPHSTRIPAPYGQVGESVTLAAVLSSSFSPPGRFRRVTGKAGLRSLRPARLRCPALGPYGAGRAVPDANRSRPYRPPPCTQVPLPSPRMRPRRESSSRSTSAR